MRRFLGNDVCMNNEQEQTEAKYRVKVTKDGPYLVTGGPALSEQMICQDAEGYCHGWRQGKSYDVPQTYTLCRCGLSKNKPFCDGSHYRAGFDGTEVADRKPFGQESKELVGPELTLSEVPALCAEARFCQRAGDTWHLVKKSSDPECRKIAIEEASECPSGRIVLKDKEGTILEPELQPSIGLIEDIPAGISGPIWVRGGIPIESADGFEYERRNRVTLCRCGHSRNKPFCDGSHLEIKFKSSE
jgi:CDGSH-type Zn-finger protein